jgi:hypothetical protein
MKKQGENVENILAFFGGEQGDSCDFFTTFSTGSRSCVRVKRRSC